MTKGFRFYFIEALNYDYTILFPTHSSSRKSRFPSQPLDLRCSKRHAIHATKETVDGLVKTLSQPVMMLADDLSDNNQENSPPQL